ncbi:MAG: hypothetical protein OCD00_18005 [Colwellia sp.]
MDHEKLSDSDILAYDTLSSKKALKRGLFFEHLLTIYTISIIE